MMIMNLITAIQLFHTDSILIIANQQAQNDKNESFDGIPIHQHQTITTV